MSAVVPGARRDLWHIQEPNNGTAPLMPRSSGAMLVVAILTHVLRITRSDHAVLLAIGHGLQ